MAAACDQFWRLFSEWLTCNRYRDLGYCHALLCKLSE